MITMDLQILTIIPALATMTWAIAVKFKGRHIFEGITLLICALALIVNGLVTYTRIHLSTVNAVLQFAQLVLSSSIVPIAYMYFSRQIGRAWNNLTTVFCWSLMVIVLLPNLNVITGSEGIPDVGIIRKFSINVIKDGRITFTCFTADLVIFIQGLLTATRMIPAGMTMRRYGLRISSKMKAFYVWWASAIAFIAFTSFSSTASLSTPAGSWTYFILYTFLICSIYSLIALKFDLHPVVTREEGEAVRVDEFIDANKNMAAKLRVLLDSGIYTQHGYTVEDAATALGTNRTYFCRMMTAEFGMKFSDLMNIYRINKAKELLSSTDMSIADIAFDTGFSDASYMGKKFQSLVGCTPGAFREQSNSRSEQRTEL